MGRGTPWGWWHQQMGMEPVGTGTPVGLEWCHRLPVAAAASVWVQKMLPGEKNTTFPFNQKNPFWGQYHGNGSCVPWGTPEPGGGQQGWDRESPWGGGT